ncbi:MAG: bacillithiol biosynthesis cysteine-adding enzyme BshC [Acidobacteria bacterium]|nr:bacillithiol biosynthesis cysteine-adding enzyme BshC [Acidobacteriota bacterium]
MPAQSDASSPSSAPSASATPTNILVRETIDLKRFPWIRPLIAAYSSNFQSVSSLFAGNPAEADAWTSTIARVQQSPRDRAGLHKVLTAQLERRNAHKHARATAARLTDPTTVAIVTGQQAGMFGGPLYTLLKAVTAIRLARKVSATYGISAIPIFWVEAEDHDWDEVKTARVLDAEMALREITLDDLEGAGTHPVSSLMLDDGIGDALAALESSLAQTEFTDDLMARLRTHYRPGQLMGTAFASWIDDLLGRYGLVVFEASDPAAKPLVASLFARELEAPCRTAHHATETGVAMRALGHDPQVEPADDSVALFYLGDTGRQSIKRREEGFATGDAVRPQADVQQEASEHPERFSPNVLLRPVVQDKLFPTICYVAGPSELAYQAQLGAIYQDFGVEVPLLYPRANATLIDSAAARFLQKYDLPFESLQPHDESALNRLLESQLPPGVEEALHAASDEIRARIEVLKAAMPGIDPTLVGAADTTLEHMQKTLKALHAKIIHASKRKHETLRRQFTRTQSLAFPDGHPQERIVDLAFFLNRYGQALCDRLIEGLPLDMGKHYVVVP